eukprot:TRINITY_DN18513_c0_g1_i1.p1 TRINITY_DN18513_c0_g1~~TRINITY_DN18513_c0_g1_i1.p1  ORF type:complete len:258 (-),score=77.54 TRINITY_DN18513_c0_g1_i1:82-855(-)
MTSSFMTRTRTSSIDNLDTSLSRQASLDYPNGDEGDENDEHDPSPDLDTSRDSEREWAGIFKKAKTDSPPSDDIHLQDDDGGGHRSPQQDSTVPDHRSIPNTPSSSSSVSVLEESPNFFGKYYYRARPTSNDPSSRPTSRHLNFTPPSSPPSSTSIYPLSPSNKSLPTHLSPHPQQTFYTKTVPTSSPTSPWLQRRTLTSSSSSSASKSLHGAFATSPFFSRPSSSTTTSSSSSSRMHAPIVISDDEEDEKENGQRV